MNREILTSRILAGICGTLPEANPTTTIRADQLMARNEASKLSPPTGS